MCWSIVECVEEAVSINKAINTQEVAVKEKHARNILILFVFEEKSCVYFDMFAEGYISAKQQTLCDPI
ncbi:hypothetical protein CRENBAI_003418 [Crenichthys baileyi]|uniref:AP180 N-terminal homology (ANTH) domain-containing protein n=1 Tax=Crenichthys baileyi TaxID=28760 RepID=A0AAV9QNK3_9TELE